MLSSTNWYVIGPQFIIVPIAQKQPNISTAAKQTKVTNKTICRVADGDESLMNLTRRLLHFRKKIKSDDGADKVGSVDTGEADARTDENMSSNTNANKN